MPLEKQEHFGTNADGSKNIEYCVYCFKGGKFTNLDFTLDQMIVHMKRLPGQPLKEADIRAQLVVLKRWKNK